MRIIGNRLYIHVLSKKICTGLLSRYTCQVHNVSDYYKIVIPHRYWTVEYKLHSAIMYGVCNVVGHPTLHHGKRRRPHVSACGFRLSKAMGNCFFIFKTLHCCCKTYIVDLNFQSIFEHNMKSRAL